MWELDFASLLLILSGFTSLLENWHLFLILGFSQVAASTVIAWLLENTGGLEQDILTSLSFVGGMLVLVIVVLALAWLKIKPSPNYLPPLSGLLLIVLLWQARQLRAMFSIKTGLLALFFIFILGVRMVFIQDLLVPPYADSIQHLQIVQDFLKPEHPAQAFYQISAGPERYYHFGFHALASWLSGLTTSEPVLVILWLGQYFQALAILALYPMTRIISKNTLSAWGVVVTSGMFLSIPAYTSNWGKYPAIASLAAIIFGLTLLYMFFEKTKQENKITHHFYWLSVLAALAAVGLHTRTMVVLTWAFLLGTLIYKIKAKNNKTISLASIKSDWELISMTAISLAVFLNVTLFLLEVPLHSQVYILLFGISMVSFYINFPLTFIIIAWFLGLGLVALFPIFSKDFIVLMDRPYLVILSFIPISLSVGICISGAIKYKLAWRQPLFLLLLIVGLANVLFLQNHKPDECCIFLNDDDLFSFVWMQQNLPASALVGVAATGQPGNYLPADGGGWTEPMLGIPTRRLFHQTNFATANSSLCQAGLTHIYVDGLPNSFDALALLNADAKHVFGLGNVSIYQLDCDGESVLQN